MLELIPVSPNTLSRPSAHNAAESARANLLTAATRGFEVCELLSQPLRALDSTYDYSPDDHEGHLLVP